MATAMHTEPRVELFTIVVMIRRATICNYLKKLEFFELLLTRVLE